jgi:glutamate racemase
LLCACSTASCVAVPHFERRVPFPLVGMLNADLQKVVCQQKNQGTIGIIATPLTVQSRAFDFLLRQDSFTIHAQPAPALVEAVTRGDLRYEIIRPVLEKVFSPMNVQTLGCLVIGCTHFYHVRELIREYLGAVPLIEPSRVAAQLLKERLTDLGWGRKLVRGIGQITPTPRVGSISERCFCAFSGFGERNCWCFGKVGSRKK